MVKNEKDYRDNMRPVPNVVGQAYFGVPGMGADYRVKVPNSEGSSSCSLRQGHGG